MAALGAFDINTVMDKIIAQNRTKLFYYSAIGMSTPNKLWVSYYMSNSTGGIDIKGRSTDVDSIYAFYKGIKQLVNNSNLRLHKLEIASGSIDDVVASSSSGPKFYEFEITNMTPAELVPPVVDPAAPAAVPGAPAAPGAAPAAPTAPTMPVEPPKKPLFNAPPQSAPATTGSDQLPKNLEKIEKF